MGRGKFLVLYLIIFALFVGGLYSLMVVVIRREIQHIYYSQMELEAQAAARRIQNFTLQSLNESTLSLTVGRLMYQPAVKFVLLVDADAIIRFAFPSQEPEVLALLAGNEQLKGVPESKLLDAIRQAQPGWSVAGFTRPGLPYRLDVIYDTSLPPQDVELVFTRTIGHITLILAIVSLVIVAFLLQQRITRRLRIQRDNAQQLAYVGTLAAGLAHEIRNPLNALAMQLEMLEEDVEKFSSHRTTDRIERIRTGLLHVEETVSEFLNYASPGQQKPAMVDLAKELGAICSEFNAEQAGGEGQVECTVAPGLAAWCDVNALRQILGNLLTNAWRIQQNRPGPRRARIEAAREGDWIVFRVDDAGPGVPDEFRSQLFECFFTTSSDGSGLGLPIARRLAEMNGGRLDLADEVSELGGARFMLRLPAQPPRRRE